MKTKFYIHIISAVAFLTGLKALAQAPGWTVNPSAYQFSMNITGVFVQSCNFSADTANKIAAFVGSELRGVSGFSVQNGNNALAFLTIFSNQPAGETVRFELYSKNTNSVIVLPVQSVFTENDLQGNIQHPFQFYTDAPVPVMTGNLVQENGGETLKFTGGKSGYTYIWYNGNTPITGAADSTLNVCRSGLYKVKVTSGECGLRWDSLQYTNSSAMIQVTKELAADDKIIHRVSATVPCDNPQANYTYQLVSGTGSTDNALFALQGDTLIRVADAQRLNYTIRLKATDSSGYSIEQSIAVEYISTPHTGMSDILPEEARIYPNPLQGDKLFIELPNAEISSIKLMDVNGKVISEYSAPGTNRSINIKETGLVPGIYFIEIRTQGNVFRKKLLKQ